MVGVLGFHPCLALPIRNQHTQYAAGELAKGAVAYPVLVALGAKHALKLVFNLFPRIHLAGLIHRQTTAFTQFCHNTWKPKTHARSKWKGSDFLCSARLWPRTETTA